MSTEPPNAPAFTADRTIAELVVPVDGGAVHDRALPFAAWLATVWRRPIRLLHVSGSVGSDDPTLDEILSAAASRYPNLSLRGEHLYGDDPATALSQAVGPHLLPVLSTEHADGWSFKGSVAEAVADHVGVPLLLVGRGAKAPLVDGEIVVGLDGTPAAEAALAAASALARSLGTRLWLVQIIAEPEPDGGGLHPEVGLELQRLVDGVDPAVVPRWEVIHSNDPVRSIEGFADRIGASVLVAAARGRTDETRTSMRSITMGLASTARRPVLVVPGHGSDGR